MKIFLQVRRHFEVVGIQTNQNHSFNQRNISSLCFYGQFVVATMVFLFIEAKNIQEYAYSFYGFATVIGSMISTLSSIWEISNTFELTTSMENFIEKSSF